MDDYAKYRSAFQEKSFPLAFVDLDALESNARTMLLRAGDKPIRIASKSIRSIPIIQSILELDPRFNGVMCYAASEAALLAKQGLDDLLVAYPVPNPATDLKPLLQYWKAGKRIVLMTDCKEHLTALQAFGVRHDVTIPICVDIDLSLRLPGLHFGVRRSPIHTEEHLAKYLQHLSNCDQLSLVGMMGYEAQVAGVGDQMPYNRLQNLAVRLLKKRSIRHVKKWRGEAVQQISDAGFNLEFVNAGGTGSLESSSTEEVVTEVTAGSGFFQSHLFDYYGAFDHLPAAGFALAIARKPAAGIFTCHMGGYIASGATGKEKAPVIWLPEGFKMDSQEGAGEVQTPVYHHGSRELEIGDPIFFRHAKAGELCEHFNTLFLLRNHKVIQEVRTYRGEGFSV